MRTGSSWRIGRTSTGSSSLRSSGLRQGSRADLIRVPESLCSLPANRRPVYAQGALLAVREGLKALARGTALGSLPTVETHAPPRHAGAGLMRTSCPQQAVLHREHRRPGTRRNADLRIDVLDVVLGRSR